MNVTFAQVSGWVVRYLLTIRISDILDIAIMAFVLYKIFTLVQSTKAASLVKGLLIFLAALVLSSALHLNGINYIMTRMVNLGLLALIILFQPEIRRVLEQVGSRRLVAFFIHEESASTMEQAIGQTVLACTEMSQSRTGALIVFEREILLDDMVRSGTVLDAAVSAELLKNIFFVKAPMHDGAVIVRHRRNAQAASQAGDAGKSPAERIASPGGRQRGPSEVQPAEPPAEQKEWRRGRCVRHRIRGISCIWSYPS